MENFTPPTLKEVTESAKKTADSFEKKPMATSYAITTFLLVCLIFYLGYQNNELQKQLNGMAQIAFQNAMQKQVIEVQADAISKTKKYIQDSIKAVDVKNYNGEIKLNTK